MKNNGLSGKKIIRLKNVVIKEKNENWNNVEKVIKIFKKNNFKYAPNFKDLNNSEYTYSYIEGLTLEKVITMPFESTIKIIEIILELQSLFNDKNGNVIVHGDLSPVNVVFDDDYTPKKIIDWDGCYFGNKYDDIAYVCWLWVNIGDDKRENIKYIEQLIKIFKILNYSKNDIDLIKESILIRINKDKGCIKNKERKEEIKNWYLYCIEWIKKYWEVIKSEFN